MRAVRFHDYGGPEALRVDDVPVPAPGAGQVLLELDAVGVTLRWSAWPGVSRKVAASSCRTHPAATWWAGWPVSAPA